jgi:VanZ family protein
MAGYWWRKASQAAAWLLAVAIAVMSLVPPSYRPVTDASHGVEHLVSFLMLGMAFGLGYSEKRSVVPAGLLVFCSAIELAQFWVPGRHARLSDFVMDTAGAWIGLALALLIIAVTNRVQSHLASGEPAESQELVRSIRSLPSHTRRVSTTRIKPP